MIGWVRVDAGIGDDPKVAQIAEAVDAQEPAVIGHLVLLLAKMATHAKTGDLASVPDAKLEAWAGWKGEAGLLAKTIRSVLCTPKGRMKAWAKHNGRAIAKAEHDAARKRREREQLAKERRRAPGLRRTSATAQDVPRSGEGTDETDETNVVKDVARPPEKPSTETWLTPYSDAWTARYGGEPSFGKLAKALRPPHDALGPAECLVRWTRYLAATEARFASPARFAETHGTYAAPTIVPCTDENGIERPHRKRPDGGWECERASGTWEAVDYAPGVAA